MGKVADFPNRDTIEAEACAWISQFDGDQPPSPEDMDALREWASRSPLHHQELERLSALWGDINILTELSQSLDNAESNDKKGVFSPAPIMAGLAAILIIAVGVMFWPNQRPAKLIHLVYSTQVGEQHLAALPDGSSVQLNTASQLEVDYSNQRRKVRLLKGEAHFEVAHDPGRPFEVYAGTGLVRAIGTAFSVHLKDKQVEVTVTEGRVKLVSVAATEVEADSSTAKEAQRDELATLSAGQSTRFNHSVDTIQTLKKDEVARKLSWRDGMLVFSGESLDHVVEQVTRYTPVSIVIADPAIRNIRIGGYFRVGETDAMFEVLESNFGIRVSEISDELFHLSKLHASQTNL
jgi:transmembrane sensor